jgi:hypothetical protein
MSEEEQEILLDDQVSDHFDRVYGDAGGGDDDPVDEPVEEVSDEEPVGDESDEHDVPVDDEPVTEDDASLYFGGQPFARQDVEQLVTWAAGLSTDQLQLIDYALRNGIDLSEPEPVVEDTAPQMISVEDALDPELALYVNNQFAALNEEISMLRETQMSQVEVEQARERQVLEAAFEEARTGVAERLGLSDDDAQALIERTNQSGIVSFLAQQQGLGSPTNLFSQALETTYWSTPEFREKSLTQQAEVAATEQRDLDAKKKRAASVGGTSASASRSKSEPKTHDERFSAMVAEIAQEIGR